nr:hypothetical protein [Tanacetum cinerariifolium]
IYVVDGKPLKFILKKPRGSTHIADGNHAESVVYNKNFPRLGTNMPNGAGHDKYMTGKPIQVRLKWIPRIQDMLVDGSDENPKFEPGLNIAKSIPNQDGLALETNNKMFTSVDGQKGSNESFASTSNQVWSDGSYANLIVAESSQVTNEERADMKPKKLNFRSFVNEEKVEDSDIVPPRYAIDKVKKDGLSVIATQIGKPLMLDAFTSSMCVEALGHINFARALIEISSDTDLKKEMIMAIPDEDGIKYTKEVINVEYEWQPPRCADCKILDHSPDRCPKIVRDHVTPISKDTNTNGFTEVKRKNHKGKKADNQHRSRHIDGIRLDEPKPNFYWQKKGTTRRRADMDSTTKVGANAINKIKGPSTSNSFDALNTTDVEDEREISSSRGNQEEEQEAGLKVSQLNEHVESDDEVDEFISPERDKFGDKFDIWLKRSS